MSQTIIIICLLYFINSGERGIISQIAYDKEDKDRFQEYFKIINFGTL